MTKNEAQEKMKMITGYTPTVNKSRDSWLFNFEYVVISFEVLQKISEEFRTKKIDLVFDRGCADYSDVTPGDPASCQIVVRDVQITASSGS